MCGIVGTISYGNRVDRVLLERQRDAMQHRGPDSSGTWISEDGRVGFGHRRLAIIDLSPGGHQPMLDPENGNAITFNGEIYNYLEIREALRADGVQFHSHSDTEVILAAYRRWGPTCLERLDGMFAFAIFDAERRTVLLARDRAGEKPLYVCRSGRGLVFASEIKALLVHPDVSRRIDPQALNEYLAYGYVTGERSLFAGIRRLLPGHFLQVQLDTTELQDGTFWTLPRLAEGMSGVSADDRATELHALLRQSIKRQLLADVPVGVLLSGGVDSSIIAAISAEVSTTRIRTFTARFPGNAAADEGPFARLVADHLGSEHVELETKPADEAVLRALVAQFDDPIADSSLIPTYLLSQEIRRHATVALGGDGGDELFGGYRHYPVQIQQEHLRTSMPMMAGAVAGAAAILPEGMPGRGFLMSLGARGIGLANSSRLFRPADRARLLGAFPSMARDDVDLPERARQHREATRDSILQQSTAADFTSYMVDDVLLKVDRASMLTSLELRAPFLSRDVIEFAFARCPDHVKANSRDRKIVLRSLGSRLLPPALDLRRKQGFDIPLDAWLQGPWKGLLDLLEQRDSTILTGQPIRALRSRLGSHPSVGERLFAIMMLLLWEEHFAPTL